MSESQEFEVALIRCEDEEQANKVAEGFNLFLIKEAMEDEIRKLEGRPDDCLRERQLALLKYQHGLVAEKLESLMNDIRGTS